MNLDSESALRLHPNDTRKLQQAVLAHFAGKKVDAASPKKASISSSSRSECPRFPPPESLIFWLDADPEVLKSGLDERVSKMVSRGLVRELDDFLTMAARSLLPGQSIVNSDGSMSNCSALLSTDFSYCLLYLEFQVLVKKPRRRYFNLPMKVFCPQLVLNIGVVGFYRVLDLKNLRGIYNYLRRKGNLNRGGLCWMKLLKR